MEPPPAFCGKKESHADYCPHQMGRSIGQTVSISTARRRPLGGRLGGEWVANIFRWLLLADCVRIGQVSAYKIKQIELPSHRFASVCVCVCTRGK